MKMKILLISLLCLAPKAFLFSVEINDSCYNLIGNWKQYGYVIFNPDSVLLDTCLCSDVPWDQCRENYAKKWYRALFPYGVFNLPEYPYDTTIYVTWEDMDTNFSEIHQKFIDLEKIFGSYKLIKEFPDRVDSSLPSRVFLIAFDNYNKIDSVNNFMQMDIEHWVFKYQNQVSWIYTSINENCDNTNLIGAITPNPASEYIEINIGDNSRRQTADEKKQWDIQIYYVYGVCLSNLSPTSYTPLTPLERGMENGVRIDVSGFPDGIYFIRIGNEIQKFVVLR
ncbi:MAG: T9SS type A sorting domain-containing protein [bacterium]